MKTPAIVSLSAKSTIALILASALALVGFFWPFIHNSQKSSFIFLLATPFAVALILIKIGNESIDSKSIALLGVLSALLASLRPLGAGAIGIEPMWFLLILSARVFGPSFGFLLGSLGMLASAFITGGFGPWLPYQIYAAAVVGMGAGLLPKKLKGQAEIFLLVIYSISAAFIFGFLMDLQFWPWALGENTSLSYIPGDPPIENFRRFITYHFAASMAWDIPRAIFTSLLIISTAKPVLYALRRTLRKASFESPIEFIAHVKAPEVKS